MQKYSKTKVIRITDIQHETLIKMKDRGVSVGNFIREAIKEKITTEYLELRPKEVEPRCPF